MILVSSCLAGYKCAYDGKDRKIEKNSGAGKSRKGYCDMSRTAWKS